MDHSEKTRTGRLLALVITNWPCYYDKAVFNVLKLQLRFTHLRKIMTNTVQYFGKKYILTSVIHTHSFLRVECVHFCDTRLCPCSGAQGLRNSHFNENELMLPQ